VNGNVDEDSGSPLFEDIVGNAPTPIETTA